jgi:hypothetical protein
MKADTSRRVRSVVSFSFSIVLYGELEISIAEGHLLNLKRRVLDL